MKVTVSLFTKWWDGYLPPAVGGMVVVMMMCVVLLLLVLLGYLFYFSQRQRKILLTWPPLPVASFVSSNATNNTQ